MRLTRVQNALKEKNITFQYTEEDGCGSLDLNFGDCVTTCGNMRKMAHGERRQMYLRQAEAEI